MWIKQKPTPLPMKSTMVVVSCVVSDFETGERLKQSIPYMSYILHRQLH